MSVALRVVALLLAVAGYVSGPINGEWAKSASHYALAGLLYLMAAHYASHRRRP